MGNTWEFRLENSERKAIFASRGFASKDEAVATLKHIRDPSFARPRDGQLHVDDRERPVVDVRDQKTDELLGTVILNSNPAGIALDVFMEQLAALA